MATLARQKAQSFDLVGQAEQAVAGRVPQPFTAAQLERIAQGAREQPLASGLAGSSRDGHEGGMDNTAGFRSVNGESSAAALHEVMPSIALVEKSCLMTLNNLLSGNMKWNPIVPERRHSMPSTHQLSTSPELEFAQPSSALHILVSNLRSLEADGQMVEKPHIESDSALLRELGQRVERLGQSLEPTDARLAHALVSLLGHFNRLSVLLSTGRPLSTLPSETNRYTSSSTDSIDSMQLFDTLKQHLSDLRHERLTRHDSLPLGASPGITVQSTLLWHEIDTDLETVMSLCRERAEATAFTEHLPPQYDPSGYEFDFPPEYHEHSPFSPEDSKARRFEQQSSSSTAGQTSAMNEKMRLDLEAITMAIDRLYIVAPQLHNQRVELKKAKLEQMEQARRSGSGKGKEKERESRELEKMLHLIGKASERKLVNQSVVLEGGMQSRLEKSRQRDLQKRDVFVEQLIQHSDAGRFHAQDAVFTLPKTKDPNALMTLPEFIMETSKQVVEDQRDPNAVISLPDFMKEPIPADLVRPSKLKRLKSQKYMRSRSLSAPSLSWLRSSASRSSLSSEVKNKSQNVKSRPGSSLNQEPPPTPSLDVCYVAEYHENLHHVLVFLNVSGALAGVDLEAEVVSSSDAPDSTTLRLRTGHLVASLSLPTRALLGKKDVQVHGAYFEIKLTTPPLPEDQLLSPADPEPLLDATQLSSASPTSFICASCSLPLVHTGPEMRYRDLPSEHWEELVDAWMCHADQRLHEEVAKHGRSGFWPEPRCALVGGSYILFDASTTVQNNLGSSIRKPDNPWLTQYCICGAVVGRAHPVNDAPDSRWAYRFAKYAVRPVSPTAELCRIPLSAFVVEDMMELVHAHATYRFVILDDEEELPRMLIWLFKPSIRLSYATPTQFSLPKQGTVHGAKVLFKLLKAPSSNVGDMKTLLSKYPGFPQAEYLYYPIAVCRRLAGLLKESNSSYPESMRVMTGLDVGWLQRA